MLGILEEAKMSLKKSFVIVATGALAGALIYGCSSSASGGNGGGGGGDDSGGGNDGSSHLDGAVHHDTGTGGDTGTPGDDSGTAQNCNPQSTSGYTPAAYKHAGRMANACTATQIQAFYDGCLAPNSTQTTCDPFVGSSATAANKTCAACIVTGDETSSSTMLGPILDHTATQTVSVNLAGCMEIKDTA